MSTQPPATEILSTSEAIKQKLVAGDILTENKIKFNAPHDLPKVAEPYLLVYLYSVTANTSLRNYEPPTSYTSSDGSINAHADVIAPPTALDLHYLFVPYGSDPAAELVMIGDIVRLFHNQPLIQPKFLPPSMREAQVRAVPYNLGIEHMYQLWSMFSSTPYELSLTYTITPVMVAANKSVSLARVNQIDEEYYRSVPGDDS